MRLDLHIVPFTLAQFSKFFRALFSTENAVPQSIFDLLVDCEYDRMKYAAPEWKAIIDQIVTQHISALQTK